MLVALVSAKGSPGVTTTAMALAAASTTQARGSGQPDAMLVELDPTGGDIELLTGCYGEPGLPRLVAGLRYGADADKIRALATDAPAGVPAVLAQPGGWAAESTLSGVADRIGPALAGLDRLVIADAGRWGRTQPTARRIDGASAVAVVCHPTPASVEHTRWLVEELDAVLGTRIVVVVVGKRPHPIEEVRTAFEVPVVGPVVWNPTGVNELCLGGSGNWRWRYSLLGRCAPRVLDELMGCLGEVGRDQVA